MGNETYAIETYGRTDAVGEVTATNRIIRGIVKDVAFGHPAEAVISMAYSSIPQPFYPLLLIETRASPAEMRAMLQQRIDAGELDLRLGDIERLADIADRDLLPDRARMTLTGTSTLLVMVLAAFGFYGTQRYLVTAGRREYAIRSSIGAGPRVLGRLVVSRGLRLGLPGLVLGVVLAFIAATWLRDGFVTRAVSPVSVTLCVMLVIVALVLAASFGPARQARGTAPGLLLRDD